jgi:hypothetical protein
MAEKVAQAGQSLFDLTLELAGDATAAMALSVENDTSVTYPLTPGSKVSCGGNPLNAAVVTYYAVQQLQPATALSEDDRVEGISIWQIGIDFVVK